MTNLANPDRTLESPRPDYVDRVNRAIDYIVANLEQPLKLETVAAQAYFSPFHFHRIFSTLVGESLNEFIKRLRLERALTLLSRVDWTGSRKPNLTEIAIDCGFNSSSDFSRSFKERFGVPPSQFDINVFREDRRDEWERAVADPAHRHLLRGLPAGDNPDGFSPTLRTVPPRRVAYIRVTKCYVQGRVTDAAERLFEWAEARDISEGQWLGYMWDDPEIVPHDKCRYDVGVEIPDDITVGGEVGSIEFPAMQIAELEVNGGIDLEMRALDWLFKTWLPGSGYLPANHPCFEAWVGRPFAMGFERFHLHVQIPIIKP